MIKFFRKIRRKLLTENKFSKYLLYAIGEIILVVIGILIALQINNWNSLQNDRDIEQSTLKNLKAEFEENLEQLRIDNDLNQASLDAAYALLQLERITYQSNRIE